MRTGDLDMRVQYDSKEARQVTLDASRSPPANHDSEQQAMPSYQSTVLIASRIYEQSRVELMFLYIPYLHIWLPSCYQQKTRYNPHTKQIIAINSANDHVHLRSHLFIINELRTPICHRLPTR
jgi:hypothetical protein